MRKKKYLIAVTLFFIVFLAACKSVDDEIVIIDDETGEEVTISREEFEEKENEIQEYSDHLSSIFNESITLHDKFAHALDAMFTKESSPAQFAKILKMEVIDSSREILDQAEKYNFPVDYYEMNQLVVMNLNNQHQLFLDAVNEAVVVSETEGSELDIVSLRERLTEVKQDYLTIVNTWKNGGVVE